MTTQVAPPTVGFWREYEPAARRAPGMWLGSAPAADDAAAQAARAFEGGARRAELREPVEPASSRAPRETVRALTLVRELTGHGIVVDWRLGLDGSAGPDAWRSLCHLYPPAELTGVPGAAEALREWTAKFYVCKCVYRQGPGFLQVRDRRRGRLECLTLDRPDELDAVAALSTGARPGSVAPGVLADFEAEDLLGTVGDLKWWLPYRVHRWPFPSTVV
ncbi:DUF5825 family protein [Streptomyces sp. NPDC059618]|uniref:DUF5825 family protein n=1 Tax=Streptomyces sp. NPDC059618 TaxID=3346887 RepID=UPI00369D9F42